MGILVALLLLAVLVLWPAWLYNKLVAAKNLYLNAFAQIQVQLKRRHDLIPNLVNAVKDYMGFEQDVLTRVTEARAGAVAAGAQGPVQAAAAENQLTGALGRLLAITENYPDLKSNTNFLALQSQLEGTENRIEISRRDYNAAVQDYNTELVTLPGSLTLTNGYLLLSDTNAAGLPCRWYRILEH